MQLPHAAPDLGKLSVTLIRHISKLTVIRQIRNLYNGTFTRHPKVSTYHCKSLKITPANNHPIFIELDGESAGSGSCTFVLKEKSLRVVTGR